MKIIVVAVETISSMIDAWKSGRFVTYPRLPGWGDTPWSMLLVPGWEHFLGLQYDEVAARQWATTTDILLGDLAQLPEDRWCAVGYEALLADPNTVLEGLAQRLGLEWDRPLPGPLPHSRTTLDAPDPEKWRRNEEQLDRVWHLVAESAARADAVLADPPTALSLAGPDTGRRQAVAARRAEQQAAVHAAFRSVHTAGFAELLAKAGRSEADLDWLIPHQANIRIMQGTARKLKLPADKLVVTVDEHGNTSAASIPLALDAAVRSGRVRRGDTVLLEGVGGGFTWGAVLMDY